MCKLRRLIQQAFYSGLTVTVNIYCLCVYSDQITWAGKSTFNYHYYLTITTSINICTQIHTTFLICSTKSLRMSVEWYFYIFKFSFFSNVSVSFSSLPQMTTTRWWQCSHSAQTSSTSSIRHLREIAEISCNISKTR